MLLRWNVCGLCAGKPERAQGACARRTRRVELLDWVFSRTPVATRRGGLAQYTSGSRGPDLSFILCGWRWRVKISWFLIAHAIPRGVGRPPPSNEGTLTDADPRCPYRALTNF